MWIRILALGMAVALFASARGTADEKEKAVEKELAQMQGIWCHGLALEFAHRNGGQQESRPLDELVKSHRIQGNKWIMYDFKGKITDVEKTITLDLSSNPKKIQLTTTRKGRDGKPDVTFTEYGIYQLNGDSLKVHSGLEDPKGGTKPAPKQFLQAGKLVEGVEGFAIGYTRIKEEDAERQRELAVAAIERLGGKVEPDLKVPGRPVVRVSLERTECKDADLAQLRAFPELRELNCEGFCKNTEKNHLTDAGLKHLKVLTKLESLSLQWHDGITDAGLEHLSGLTSLRELNLSFTRVSEAGVKKLQRSLTKTRISH